MNATKPRARKKSSNDGTCKSVIYALLMDNPDTPVAELAKAANCTPQLVYNYRHNFRKEMAQTSWKKNPPQNDDLPAPKKPSKNGHVSNDTLLNDIKLIKSIGPDRAEAAAKAIRLILS